jgi:integrase
MLSQLPDKVIEISKHQNRHKNARQISDWENNVKRSLGTLKAALGRDVEVLSIGPAEARLHRRKLQDRVNAGEIMASTAAKDLTYASSALKRYYDHIALGEPPNPYAGVTLTDKFEEEARKLQFSNEWIREVLLTSGKLDAMNAEGRDALLVLLETGCRQGEVLDLAPEDIHLDAPIPYFALRHVEGGREIKNMSSKRKVPLVGVALAAMKRHPEGFPKYRGKDTFSATVNKFLKMNGLMQSPEHTVGGLRHSWEARMEAAGYDNEKRGFMMGHSMKVIRGREVYGDDAELEARKAIAESIMFHEPDPFAELGTRVVPKPRKKKGA